MNELLALEKKVDQILDQLMKIREERDSFKRKCDEKDAKISGLEEEIVQFKEERLEIHDRVSSLIQKLEGLEPSQEGPTSNKELFGIE